MGMFLLVAIPSIIYQSASCREISSTSKTANRNESTAQGVVRSSFKKKGIANQSKMSFINQPTHGKRTSMKPIMIPRTKSRANSQTSCLRTASRGVGATDFPTFPAGQRLKHGGSAHHKNIREQWRYNVGESPQVVSKIHKETIRRCDCDPMKAAVKSPSAGWCRRKCHAMIVSSIETADTPNLGIVGSCCPNESHMKISNGYISYISQKIRKDAPKSSAILCSLRSRPAICTYHSNSPISVLILALHLTIKLDLPVIPETSETWVLTW